MSGWPMVTLREVLRQVVDVHPVRADQTYPTFGVYGFGRGLFQKPPISGSTIKADNLYRARKGQFVYSRLKAFEGAYGVVTEGLDGHFVSNEFPTFDCLLNRLVPEYLLAYFRMPSVWRYAAQLSAGVGARRERLQPEQLLTLLIPLPSVDEQRRLVAKIDELAAKVEEARKLRDEADAGYDAMCRSVLLHGHDEQALLSPMRDLVRLRPADVDVRKDESYHFAGVYCFGRGVFVGQKRTGLEFAYPTLTRLRTNDFVYPKLMAWEGALAVVPPECDGLVVSTEFPVFEIDQEKVLPEVLDVYFRNPSVWPKLSGASTGTNVRRRRLNPSDFLTYRMPLPPMWTQLRLREVYRRVKEIKKVHARTTKELVSLAPSLLEAAFKGNL